MSMYAYCAHKPHPVLLLNRMGGGGGGGAGDMQVCCVSKTADAAAIGTLTQLRGKEASRRLPPLPAAKKDGRRRRKHTPPFRLLHSQRKVTPSGAQSGSLAASLQQREAQPASVLGGGGHDGK